MVDYRCPVCGKPVLPNFKFCKSCGARITRETFEEQVPTKNIHSTIITTEKQAPVTAAVETIDPEIVYSLAIKGRMINIDKEMEEILEEIENLEERVKVGLVPKEDAKSRVEELNKRFVEIKLEKKKLTKGGTTIPILELIDKRDQAKDRLIKLDGLKKDKSISDKTYEKMKNEYLEAISSSERQISQEIIKMERWKDQLGKELIEKRELLEALFVRKSTGELSEEEYNKQKDQLTEEIKNWGAALEELKKTLKNLIKP